MNKNQFNTKYLFNNYDNTGGMEDIPDESYTHPVDYIEPEESTNNDYREASTIFIDMMAETFRLLLDSRMEKSGKLRVIALAYAYGLNHLTDKHKQKDWAELYNATPQTLCDMIADYKSKLQDRLEFNL
tara:strand:- start:275 stop:661 length:387 start_codon:yes stop_codon:yes gene_type:complete